MLRRPAAPVLATAILAGLVTALIALLPELQFAYRQREVHVAFESAAALVALLASYLLLGRFRRRRRLDDLALFAALALFALTNLFFAALPAMVFDGESGKFSTWAAVFGRLLGAAALTAGAFMPVRRVRLARRATGLAFVTLFVLLGTTAILVGGLVSKLPSGVETVVAPDVSRRAHLVGHPAVLAVQLLVGALFAAAAVGFTRRSDRERDPFVAWLAVACVLAAVARVNYFLYPSLYTDWVYLGDALRLLFYVVVLAAALREISSYWEVASRAAVLEERRRIARDLHDGLAQELAFVGRNLRRLDPENPYVRRAAAAVERGLDDARRAIAALAEPVDEPLDVVLARAARDVAAREGTEVLLTLAPDVDAPPETREALVRIVSEAITNAARHGHADLVRVELENGSRLRMRVRDSGAGFDPATARPRDGRSGFGLRAMRDRAAALGGELRVDAEPGRGTEVEVVL